MDRDHNRLKWISEERREYYFKVNSSEYKKQGDHGEEIGKQFLLSLGYEVRDSSAVSDAQKHTDFYFRFPGSTDWHTIDVKYKNGFPLEMRNYWGNNGWLFTGAEYILQIYQNTNDIYLFKRKDMVRYYQDHIKIFDEKYCKSIGRALIWFAGLGRIAEWLRLKIIVKLR